MSLASVAAQQNSSLTAAANAAAAGVGSTTAATSTAVAATGKNALSSLSGNFQDFLKLLMTQLQNQDPTTPLDTNQFTTQLVQFASVEQQINTNSSLTQLIQLTQGGEILQSSAMVGHHVSVASDHLPLQNGTGEVQFTATTPGPVAIAIYNDGGKQIADATVQATVGTNTWTWNGATSGSGTAADGTYRVAVVGADASGTATALPFTVVGVATGVVQDGTALDLQLGAQSVGFSNVKSVLD